MDGLRVFLIVLSGVVSCSHDWVSGSVLEVTARAGDNITLYCDCRTSSGVYTVWYRNCSHENQPSLVLGTTRNSRSLDPHFKFVYNSSSESYDMLIMNITDSDEGLYYCGTETSMVEEEGCIYQRHIYTYGNITTRIIFRKEEDSSEFRSSTVPVVFWVMVFTPAFTVLLSFCSFILVYHFFQKTDKETPIVQKRLDTRGQTRWSQDEDVCLTQVLFQPLDE